MTDEKRLTRFGRYRRQMTCWRSSGNASTVQACCKRVSDCRRDVSSSCIDLREPGNLLRRRECDL
jgi:hypothetical protein